MAVDSEALSAKLEVALNSIKRHIEREEFDKVLPLCNRALDVKHDLLVVRRCRVFALLNLSRWSDALKACEKDATDQEAFTFERAYCLYRLNRFQDALDVLSSQKGPAVDAGRRARLDAQVRYRMGEYEKCAAMYQSLYSENPNEVGLLVNAVASYVSGDGPEQALKLMQNKEDLLDASYELCFNLACACIEEGRLGEAEARLQDAKRVCEAELRQGEGEEEQQVGRFDEELAAIHVQQGCVLQRRGKTVEANDLYQRVLKLRLQPSVEVDVTVLAVACNNLVAFRPEGKSLFDSIKRLKVAAKESLDHKLTRKQTLEIGINKCLLLLQAHKMDEARKELQRLHSLFPGHPRMAIAQAALAFHEKKSKTGCEDVLQRYLAEHPGSEEVIVQLAQLHAQQNRLDRAVEVLTQLPLKRRAQPHIVSTVVAMHQRQKSPDKAIACLRQAIEYWTSLGDSADEDTFGSVLRFAAQLAMSLKDRAFAAEAYQLYLERIDGADVDALCGLVQALAATDVERATQYAQRLRVPTYDHLDPEELEAAPIPKITFQKRRDKDEGISTADGKVDEKKPKKRRKRIRYPKGFDPANPGPPPDPERWLPKHERTEFKKRMRKRDKQLLRGPQGSMPADSLDFRKQGPSTAQVEAAKDTSRRGAKGAKKPAKK